MLSAGLRFRAHTRQVLDAQYYFGRQTDQGKTVQNVKVVNSPARVYSVSNPAPLTMSKLTIDNCMRFIIIPFIELCSYYCLIAAGDQPNSKSGGKAAGHNTDGFDCSTKDLTIQDRYALFLRSCML